MNHYRQFNELDLEMTWNATYYTLVEAPRPIATIIPALQYVKEMKPHTSYLLWPPSTTKQKKSGPCPGGGGDGEAEDCVVLHDSIGSSVVMSTSVRAQSRLL